jgi:hypothetical protein
VVRVSETANRSSSAENGQTLSKIPQPVPGGILRVEASAWWPKFLRDLFDETISNGFTAVAATGRIGRSGDLHRAERPRPSGRKRDRARPPGENQAEQPLLGNNCYIGSISPVQIDFTSGTTSPPPPNESISGAAGEIKFNEYRPALTPARRRRSSKGKSHNAEAEAVRASE